VRFQFRPRKTQLILIFSRSSDLFVKESLQGFKFSVPSIPVGEREAFADLLSKLPNLVDVRLEASNAVSRIGPSRKDRVVAGSLQVLWLSIHPQFKVKYPSRLQTLVSFLSSLPLDHNDCSFLLFRLCSWTRIHSDFLPGWEFLQHSNYLLARFISVPFNLQAVVL